MLRIYLKKIPAEWLLHVLVKANVMLCRPLTVIKGRKAHVILSPNYQQ